MTLNQERIFFPTGLVSIKGINGIRSKTFSLTLRRRSPPDAAGTLHLFACQMISNLWSSISKETSKNDHPDGHYILCGFPPRPAFNFTRSARLSAAVWFIWTSPAPEMSQPWSRSLTMREPKLKNACPSARNYGKVGRGRARPSPPFPKADVALNYYSRDAICVSLGHIRKPPLLITCVEVRRRNSCTGFLLLFKWRAGLGCVALERDGKWFYIGVFIEMCVCASAREEADNEK